MSDLGSANVLMVMTMSSDTERSELDVNTSALEEKNTYVQGCPY